MIAAAIVAKNNQRKKNPWNLPTVLWKTLTREQQKMWSDLREAARVRGTKSGTPPFQLEAGNQDQYGRISRESLNPT